MRYDRKSLFLSSDYNESSDRHISDDYVYIVNVYYHVASVHTGRGKTVGKWQLYYNKRKIKVIGRAKNKMIPVEADV